MINSKTFQALWGGGVSGAAVYAQCSVVVQLTRLLLSLTAEAQKSFTDGL